MSRTNSPSFLLRLRLTTLTLCTTVLLGAGMSLAAEQRKFTVDQLVDYFDIIVFGSELDPKYASRVVAKWQGPIGYSIDGRAFSRFEAVLEGYIATVERLSGLVFRRIDPSDPSPGISFVFVPRARMSEIPVPSEYQEAIETAATNAACYFVSWKKPEYRITKAIVVVDVERDPAIINSCLLEELVQSLGLPNDSDALRPSVFSDHDRLFELAPQDRILLYTLYHPRMRPGLERGAALKTAREIILDLAESAKSPTSHEQGG